MMKAKSMVLIFLLLILVQSFQNSSTNQSEQLGQIQLEEGLQIDQERLKQINIAIKSYFKNCVVDEESNVLYNCSIRKEDYAEFLYSLFHKELILSFLQYYQLTGKLSAQNQVAQMYKVGQKVHEMVVAAYNDWIQIYKPNPTITVEEMYDDLSQIDAQVLDVIQHKINDHTDFVNVLTQIQRLSPSPKRYIVMGNKSEQEIAEDYAGILRVYFGECRPLSECRMPLNRFVYFVKELSFYITPLVEEHKNKEIIIVSEQMDFKATEFLINQVQKLKRILGPEVNYEELENYSQNLATHLFEHLKGQEQNVANPQREKYQEERNRTQNGHEL